MNRDTLLALHGWLQCMAAGGNDRAEAEEIKTNEIQRYLNALDEVCYPDENKEDTP